MLINVDSKTFKHYFQSNPHPFISEPFSELNKGKADYLLRLIEDNNKPSIGLVAGVKNEIIHSPFSAPFGGFHFRNENIYIGKIEEFLDALKEYILSKNYKGIEIILPPDIYHLKFNSKAVNSFIRKGFHMSLPDITNWINLVDFNGTYSQRNSREYYKQALKNNLSFSKSTDRSEQERIFNLIKENRARFDRPIFMDFQDILNTEKLWPVNFFKVEDLEGTMVASAILYPNHEEICYAVFWGDNDIGRPLRAMDYLVHNLCSYFKKEGFKYIDLGISTESGVPNEGLLRFKESHEATSSIRYMFSWKPDN